MCFVRDHALYTVRQGGLIPETASICRKCIAPKPPRTHHCSVCNKCVLKMDHHCRILLGDKCCPCMYCIVHGVPKLLRMVGGDALASSTNEQSMMFHHNCLVVSDDLYHIGTYTVTGRFRRDGIEQLPAKLLSLLSLLNPSFRASASSLLSSSAVPRSHKTISSGGRSVLGEHIGRSTAQVWEGMHKWMELTPDQDINF